MLVNGPTVLLSDREMDRDFSDEHAASSSEWLAGPTAQPGIAGCCCCCVLAVAAVVEEEKLALAGMGSLFVLAVAAVVEAEKLALAGMGSLWTGGGASVRLLGSSPCSSAVASAAPGPGDWVPRQ